MGWQLRKSFKIAPGVRLNMSKRGLGVSAGPRGTKVSLGGDGKVRRTISIPGTGISHRSIVGGRRQAPAGRTNPVQQADAAAVQSVDEQRKRGVIPFIGRHKLGTGITVGALALI